MKPAADSWSGTLMFSSAAIVEVVLCSGAGRGQPATHR